MHRKRKRDDMHRKRKREAHGKRKLEVPRKQKLEVPPVEKNLTKPHTFWFNPYYVALILQFFSAQDLVNTLRISPIFAAAASKPLAWKTAYPRVRVKNVAALCDILERCAISRIWHLTIDSLDDVSEITSRQHITNRIFVARINAPRPCKTDALVYFVDSFKKVNRVTSRKQAAFSGLGFDNMQNEWNLYKLLQSKKCRSISQDGLPEHTCALDYPFHLATRLSLRGVTISTAQLVHATHLSLNHHCNLVFSREIQKLGLRNFCGHLKDHRLFKLCSETIESVLIAPCRDFPDDDPVYASELHAYGFPALQKLTCSARFWRRFPILPSLESLTINTGGMDARLLAKINQHPNLEYLCLEKPDESLFHLELPNLQFLSFRSRAGQHFDVTALKRFPSVIGLRIHFHFPLQVDKFIDLFSTPRSLCLGARNMADFLRTACESKASFITLKICGLRSIAPYDSLDWSGLILPKMETLVIDTFENTGTCFNVPPRCEVHRGTFDSAFLSSFVYSTLIVADATLIGMP